MSKKAKWTAAEVVGLIRKKFGDTQRFAVFEQVCEGTGWQARSWVDAAVVHLWPSDGCRREAFEVKVARSDFLAELQNPAKNAWTRDVFHTFSFVTAPGVVKDVSEIPQYAGWYLATRGGLQIKKGAQIRDDLPLNDVFVASMCRAAIKQSERERRDIHETVLTESHEYQTALRYQEAVQRFALSRNARMGCYDDNVDDLVHALEECTQDSQSQQDRKAILQYLDAFQDRMLDLGDMFAVLAHVGLMERDELGERIVKTYGGKDMYSLANSREEAARKKVTKHEKRDHNTTKLRVERMEKLMLRVAYPEPEEEIALTSRGPR